MRSSSTAYSSKGHRHNSVYSSSETADIGGQQQLNLPSGNSKTKFSDRFNRKSSRKHRGALFKRGNSLYIFPFINTHDSHQLNIICTDSKSNMNGMLLSSGQPKNRPRIPTPDVPSADIATTTSTSSTTIANGVTIMPGNLAGSNLGATGINGNNGPVVGTLFLTPIKEQDSGSAHNTLHAGSPATHALASTVFSTQLQPNTGWGTGTLYLCTLCQITLVCMKFIRHDFLICIYYPPPPPPQPFHTLFFPISSTDK